MDLSSVPGLGESTLGAGDLASLPLSTPPAPWSCRARALLWIQRATAPEFDWAGRALPLGVVVFVDYLDTPVGPYQEVLAGALVRRGVRLYAQVPFIAVNSLPSVHGGRSNWGLPKTMASFAGSALSGRVSATGDGWAIDVSPRSPGRSSARSSLPSPARSSLPSPARTPAGSSAPSPAPSPARAPRVPAFATFSSVGPLGHYRTTLRARVSPLRVTAEVRGPALTPWLGRGPHLALVGEGTMHIGAPVTPAS